MRETLAMLSAELLGQSRITIDDRVIDRGDWPSKSARALGLLLLISPGREISRDRALDVFWPHLDPAAARNALAKALHGVKSTLQLNGLPLIVADRERIAIATAVETRIDADEFARRARAAVSEQNGSSARRTSLRSALELYQGDLLAAEIDSPWAEPRRESLRRLRRDATLALAELDIAADAPLASLLALEALWRTDPTDEAVLRQMILGRLAAGQPDRALSDFDRGVAAIRRDLGAEPSSDLLALRDRLIQAPPEPVSPTINRRRFIPPAPPGPLIGRDRDLDILEDLLTNRETRLVTLTGPGGVGKTRLALEIASRLAPAYASGACLVELAEIDDAGLVAAVVARSLGLQPRGSVTPLDALAAIFRDGSLLLVLDNLEQIRGAGAVVANLLTACPAITILATSRHPLHIRAEHEVEVPPLDTDGARRGGNPAVELFLQRAAAVRRDLVADERNLAAVTEICRRLDGLPLAIELAAARARRQSPAELLATLERRLDVLTDGFHDLPDRQRTMRDAIAWSFNLLSGEERRWFQSRAVFRGGFDVEAAAALAGDASGPAVARSMCAALAEKSLLRSVDESGERFAMLETIREFGLESLDAAGLAAETRERHACWFAELARRGAGELYGRDQIAWIDRLDRDHANLIAALEWRLDRGDLVSARSMTAALWRFWLARSLFTEGASWCRRVLATDVSEATADLAECWYGLGSLLNRIGDYPAARAAHETALADWRALGDRRGESRTLTAIAALTRREADYPAALRLLDDALRLARDAAYDAGVATAHNHIGLTLTILGREDEAEMHFAESLAMHERLGDDYAVSILLNNLGEIASRRGDLAAAAAAYERALAISRQMDSRDGIAAELVNLAGGRLRLGEIDAARRIALEAVAELRALGDVDYLAEALGMLGETFRVSGDLNQARRSFREALLLDQRRNDLPEIADCFEALAGLDAAEEQLDRAARLLGAAAALRAAIGAPPPADERAELDELVRLLRANLGDDAFAIGHASGRAMPLDDSIALALSNHR